jgi:hypothetical protein
VVFHGFIIETNFASCQRVWPSTYDCNTHGFPFSWVYQSKGPGTTMHHETWMTSGQETIFRWFPVL